MNGGPVGLVAALVATATPMQSPATPGQMIALLLFLGFVVSVVLSITILAKGVQSYRRTRDPALLGMAAGILLLSGAPLVINLVLGNTTTVTPEVIRLIADLTRLGGLGLILYVIYRTQR